jgi:probable phosphoglycerate mutase
VVVVAHGVVCKVLLLSLLSGYSLADWRKLEPIHNTGVSELIRTDAGWQAVRINQLLTE